MSLAQRRKGAKRYRVSKGFLCAFAPLREKYFFANAISSTTENISDASRRGWPCGSHFHTT
jgi:hypothetical protein